MTGKWEKLGATHHSKDCHGRFNWLNIQTFAKLLKIHQRKIRVFRNEQFRGKSRIRQIHQCID